MKGCTNSQETEGRCKWNSEGVHHFSIAEPREGMRKLQTVEPIITNGGNERRMHKLPTAEWVEGVHKLPTMEPREGVHELPTMEPREGVHSLPITE